MQVGIAEEVVPTALIGREPTVPLERAPAARGSAAACAIGARPLARATLVGVVQIGLDPKQSCAAFKMLIGLTILAWIGLPNFELGALLAGGSRRDCSMSTFTEPPGRRIGARRLDSSGCSH